MFLDRKSIFAYRALQKRNAEAYEAAARRLGLKTGSNPGCPFVLPLALAEELRLHEQVTSTLSARSAGVLELGQTHVRERIFPVAIDRTWVYDSRGWRFPLSWLPHLTQHPELQLWLLGFIDGPSNRHLFLTRPNGSFVEGPHKSPVCHVNFPLNFEHDLGGAKLQALKFCEDLQGMHLDAVREETQALARWADSLNEELQF